MQLSRIIRTLALATIAVGAACGGDQQSPDAALENDLSLAAQQQTQLDSVSALEAGAAGATLAAPATVRRSTATSTAPRRTTSTVRRTSGSTSGGTAPTSSSGTVTTTSSGGDVVIQKNTKRDAAIGAAAGAVIGAATSKDKVKGAVIGGVVGGVLGGVIGNNVDVKKTKKPPV